MRFKRKKQHLKYKKSLNVPQMGFVAHCFQEIHITDLLPDETTKKSFPQIYRRIYRQTSRMKPLIFNANILIDRLSFALLQLKDTRTGINASSQKKSTGRTQVSLFTAKTCNPVNTLQTFLCVHDANNIPSARSIRVGLGWVIMSLCLFRKRLFTTFTKPNSSLIST